METCESIQIQNRENTVYNQGYNIRVYMNNNYNRNISTVWLTGG